MGWYPSEPWRSAFTGLVTEYVVYALAIHPHGTMLAVSGDDASIELWTLHLTKGQSEFSQAPGRVGTGNGRGWDTRGHG